VSVFRIALTTVAALAWIPIAVFFFRNFKARGNPISLAILTLVALIVVAIGPLDYWVTVDRADARWLFPIIDSLSLAVCLHFYLAILWARRKYSNARNGHNQENN